MNRWTAAWRAAVTIPAAHPTPTILVTLLICAACVLAVLRLRPEPTLDAMFPENHPASRSLLRIMHSFSAAEEMLILASVAESAEPAPAKLLAFAGRLEKAVTGSRDLQGMCDGISYQVDEQMRRFFEKQLVPGGLFYLTDAQIEQARERITLQGMREQIAQNEAMIAAPGPAAAMIAKITLKDPLRLHEFVMDRLMGARPFKTYQNSEAFLTPDGKSLLIRVRGTRPPSDIEFSKSFTRLVTNLASSVNDDRLQLDYAGSYPIATASEKAIRADMVASVTGSVICLQLLFILAYRKPIRLFAMAFAPVVIGVLLGFALNSIVQTQITPITAVIGAILAGLAIDYSVYVISDYETHRRSGLAPRDAARETVLAVAPAIFAAWFTSAIGFMAIGYSSIPGIRDFARIGALGLSGAFASAILVLPGVLALADRRGALEAQARPQMRFRTVGLLMFISRFRWLCVCLTALMIVGSVVVLAMSREGILPLERDLTTMHPRPNAPIAAQQMIARRFGTSPDALLLHVEADTPENLVHQCGVARARLLRPEVRQAGGITGSFGLADLLPDPTTVPQRLERLKTVDAAQVVRDFRAAVAESSFDMATYEPYAEFLQTLLTRERAPSINDLLEYPSLARNLLPAASIANKTPPTEAIMLVFVETSLDDQQERAAAVNTVRNALADLKGVTLTGMNVIGLDTATLIRHDLPILIGIAAVAVSLYLLIHFRNIGSTILALLPMLASLLVLLAAARLVDQRLNIVNLVAVPMLVGIDVDYGIFMVSIASLRSGLSRRALAERIDGALYAVFVCAASALLGFGTLYFTSVPAIQSLGFAVAVGITASLIFTLFFRLPLIFAKGEKDEQ